MKSNSLLIIGCGDLGLRTAAHLGSLNFDVTGVCRHPENLPDGMTGFAADYTESGSLDGIAALAPDYVLVTTKPLGMNETGYQRGFPLAMANLLKGLGDHRPKLILMASSTRVFGEQDGGWVDESSPLASTGYAAGAIIEAEQRLQQSGHASCIVRFAGLYGGANPRLLQRIRDGVRGAEQPLRYTNRLHREDAAGFIAHLLCLETGSREACYIGSDKEPAPRYEVEQWLAARMGLPEPGNTDKALPDAGAGHKRCCSDLMRQTGYSLIYPNYRVGYGALLEADA